MQTTEYGLKKPESEDFYNVEDFNDNVDILEAHLGNDESHVNIAFIASATEATALEQINSTDTISKVWGKIKKAIATLISHAPLAATSSTLGHIKIGTGLQSTSGTASVKLTDSVSTDDSTTALSAKGAKALNDAKAPNSHASTATTYGIGNATNYGHIKLSDTYKTNAGGASAALGASQAALYGAYDELNTNLAPIGTTFSKSQSTADINANSWQDITGVSLTLPAGVYSISAFASIDNVPRTVTIRFSNNTDKRQSISGESGLMISGSMTQNVKFESETTIYLSAYVSATQTALKNIVLEATRTK